MATSQPFQMGTSGFTFSAQVAVIGARFVKAHSTVTDNNFGCQPAGAGDPVIGVAATDQPTVGQAVQVWNNKGIVTEVTCGAVALTAGMQVQSDASGQAVVLASGVRAGVCLADTAIGALAPIQLG